VCIHIVGVALSVRCHVQTNCSKFKFTITNTMRAVFFADILVLSAFNQCVKGGATIPLLLAHHCNHPAVARTANIVHIRAADYRHCRISFDQLTSGVARTCSHLVAPHRLGSTREPQSSLPTHGQRYAPHFHHCSVGVALLPGSGQDRIRFKIYPFALRILAGPARPPTGNSEHRSGTRPSRATQRLGTVVCMASQAYNRVPVAAAWHAGPPDPRSAAPTPTLRRLQRRQC
jgi:hypothetical protein